jgi:hypothetical protein
MQVPEKDGRAELSILAQGSSSKDAVWRGRTMEKSRRSNNVFVTARHIILIGLTLTGN